ncbi:MAG: hypothetical protein JO182_10170 [Acidobacteriaceae bacterium]|nr:hypothetical protein [Acidobacteriaceae bacterium]MBV9034845.1 hypothetical protein [Acidobacteriaceae bacterium]MBV9306478.1 hypothetical protein [Acidobacteriaceae bacterium]
MSFQINRDLALWIGVLAGPVFWLCSFEAKFAWAPWACTFQTKLALYLVSLLALLLTAASGVLAWRQWKELGKDPAGEASGALARSRFMAIGGIVFSVSFCMVIVAQAIPELMLGACE